ncbi:MAG: DUF3866 family protein [Caldicoprobacterales bacterium]
MQMGRVKRILSQRDGVTEVMLEMDHPVKKAINYDHITGKVSVGDWLILNTTAGSLSLGTGGYHFVMVNRAHETLPLSPGGHGMKVRYTPFQVKVPFVEEEFFHLRDSFNSPLDLEGRLICFGELHSMIPPLCAYFHYYCPNKPRIGYIMTDHAALPLAFSKNITQLKEKKLLDTVITIGNAFGGDLECVNIYSALQAACLVEKCDIILVSMGPGITGTGTRYGFSGLELGLYLDLVYRHGGLCCFIPRISFSENRLRHYGLSHHFITILKDILQSALTIVLPCLDKRRIRYLYKQLRENHLLDKYGVCIIDGSGIRDAMEYYGISVTSMNRGIREDPAFFYGIGASAKKALSSFYSLDRV